MLSQLRLMALARLVSCDFRLCLRAGTSFTSSRQRSTPWNRTTMTLFNLPAYLDWPAQFCLFSTLATYVASLITSNVSQVDRLWTFLPTIYTAHYALLPLLPNSQSFWLVPYSPKELGFSSVKDYSPRALLMLSLVCVWMTRLAFRESIRESSTKV